MHTVIYICATILNGEKQCTEYTGCVCVYRLTLAGGLRAVPLEAITVHDGVSAQLEAGTAFEGDHAALQQLSLLSMHHIRWRQTARL